MEGGLISLQIKQSNKLGHCRDPAEGSHEHRQTDGDPHQQSPQVSRNSQENRGYEKGENQVFERKALMRVQSCNNVRMCAYIW